MAAMEREIEQSKKLREAERKQQEEMIRERDILNKLKTHAENSTQQQLNIIKINENTKRNLEQEIQGYKVEAQKQMKLLYQLEKEREKYGSEASDATAKYLQVKNRVFFV